MEAATAAGAGGRKALPNERPRVGLPLPPTDAERDSYFVRHALLVMSLSIVAFIGLLLSSLHFALGSTSVLPYMLAVLFTGSYFVVALSVSAFTRSADKDAHFARMEIYGGAWPSVDVLLPICGEPIEVLGNTWHHVAQLDYDGPLEVYVLDDKPSDEHRALAESYGFSYLTRPNPGWFKKAGNLKYGYENSDGSLLAILDADFCPRPDYLRHIVPYFEEPKLGIVQTPQFFQVVPGQSWLQRGAGAVQEFFYRFIQTSRDHHEGAICVGTCAVYRREALDENGGTTLIEHSEDVHTGFDLKALGWSLRYVPVNLATGICPDEVEAFFRQQYRWCAGSMSLLRSEKFWKTPLPLLTRFCYMSGFFYYSYTALWTFIGPAIPLILLLAFPEKIHLANYIILLPALIYDYIIFPLWHRSRYRLEVWSVRRIFGWAHAFAIADTLRGRPMGWTPTGTQASGDKQVRVWKVLYLLWGGVTICVWLGTALYRGATMGWIDFLPILLLGLIYAIAILRVYQPTGGTDEMIAPSLTLKPVVEG
jgi:cellulose synthase (UDP-forming)